MRKLILQIRYTIFSRSRCVRHLHTILPYSPYLHGIFTIYSNFTPHTRIYFCKAESFLLNWNLLFQFTGELSELITKGASPSWQGFNYTDDPSQTLFLTSENVKNGYIDLSSPKYIEDKFNTKQKRSIVHKGDFLINIVGASIGRAAQFNLNCKANMNQAAALVRINDNRIRDKYLLTYLNSDKAQLMYDSMKSDTGRANLSLKDISELSILLPSIEEQLIFEKVVAQIDKSKLLSGCRLFHSWAPEIEKSESCWRAPTEDKGFAGMSTPTMTPADRKNLNHVGVPRRRTKDLRGCRRQQ